MMNEIQKSIGQLIAGAATLEEKDDLIQAEQDTIAYFYDMMKFAVRKHLLRTEDVELPDASIMQAAVQTFDRASIAQGQEALFQGDRQNMRDLFAFAREVALEAEDVAE